MEEEAGLRYRIDRAAHTEADFQEKMGVSAYSEPSFISKAKMKVKRSCACSKDCALSFLTGLFPIATWLRRYKTQNIAGDIVAGLTVGVVHIPQSLAFSILAGLAPVFGLYTSFYPVLIYTLMGTSRHISVGTFAVTSLLTRSVVNRFYPPELDLGVNATADIMSTTMGSIPNVTDSRFSELDLKRAGVAAAVTFLMGIFQLAFGALRLGFITSYLSEPLIQGFTTGAAFQVVTSQTPTALGLVIRGFSGPLAFIFSWVEIFRNLPNTHVATLIISIFCIIFLSAGREINMRYGQKMKVPLPTEVILVIIAILASHFGELQEEFSVAIVDNVPTGFPPPMLPDMSIIGSVVADGFALAVVGFAISVSLSKMYGMRQGYSIDANQELVAYGTANIIPSFFLCFPSAAALARCEIQYNTGGKTQVVGIISVVIVLIVILVLGPVFEPLPRAVLACIIIVGLFGIIAQLKNLKPLYKTSKIDFVVWVFTWLAVVLLGVDLGLLAGVVFAIITVIARTQIPRFEVLANVANTDLYRAQGRFHNTHESNGIVILKMHASLYYANKDFFKRKALKAVGFDPGDILSKRKQAKERAEEILKGANSATSGCCGFRKRKLADRRQDQVGPSGGDKNASTIELAQMATIDKWRSDIRGVIVDCASFGFVDFSGAKILKQLAQQFKELGILFLLTNCSVDVRDQLRRSGLMDVLGEQALFVSIHDAVIFVENGQLPETPSVTSF